MPWTSTPPTAPGQFWLKGPGLTTCVVSVYDAKEQTPGGVWKGLHVAHPSFGHMRMTSKWLDDKSWGPEVTPPA